MISLLVNWVETHDNLVIEIFGVVTALIYLFFSIRQKIWLWPFGILTSSFYIMVFFRSRLYADMGLQIYYLIISFYGWYFWLFKGPEKGKNSLEISTTTPKLAKSLFFITFLLYWLLVAALMKVPHWLHIPGSSLIFWDAFTTAASITATWMLARKILEQWLVWIVVDLVSLGLYIYKGLYLTAGLFLVYSLLAVFGFMEWKKSLKTGSPASNR